MDMLEIIIIILLVFIIARDIGRYDRFYKRERKVDEAKEQEQKERRRELDNIMNYSIEKAIESKRSEE